MIPEDYVQETRSIESLSYCSIEYVIEVLTKESQGLTDPQLEVSCYDDYNEWQVSGYRPKNEKELERERKKAELDKENAKKSREQQQKAEWTMAKNLYRKYKKELEDVDANGEEANSEY